MVTPSTSDPTAPSLFKRFLQLLGLDKSLGTTAHLEQEIQDLIEDGEELGLITSQEGMMINSIFDFRETMAREIMTPRNDMVCAPDTATVPELISLIIEKGFTRIPIYSETQDNITGIIHAKDLLKFCSNGQPQPKAGNITNQPLTVMENHKIIDLLRDFKSKTIHLAIVRDEFGGVRGLVTLEDVLEEIVGEITDEYDQDNIRWKVIDQNTVLTDAKIDIEEVENYFGMEMPDGSYESVGGLVIQQLGRLAKAGDQVTVDTLSFQVMSASKRRINMVKVSRVIQKETSEE